MDFPIPYDDSSNEEAITYLIATGELLGLDEHSQMKLGGTALERDLSVNVHLINSMDCFIETLLRGFQSSVRPKCTNIILSFNIERLARRQARKAS